MKAMCSTCHVRKVVYISEYFLVVMILKTSLMVKSNIENYVRCEVVDGVIATIKKGKSTISKEEHAKEIDFYLNKIELIAANAHEKFTEEELRPKHIGFESEITTAELVEFIPGPDFPTGGAIYDAKSLVEVYETGRGRIVVRRVCGGCLPSIPRS